MGKHSLSKPSNVSASQIHDSEIANALEPVFAKVLNEQSWFEKRKNTLAAVAQSVLQISNFALFAGGVLPLWATISIGIVVFVAEIIVHATTRGPVTPSGVDRIKDAMDQVTQEVPGVLVEVQKNFGFSNPPMFDMSRYNR